MQAFNLDIPRRAAILYVRVSHRNKQFIEALALENDVPTSIYIDNLLSQVRDQRGSSDSSKVKLRKANRKVKSL